MRWGAAVILLASCGRLDFSSAKKGLDASSDGAADALASGPTFVDQTYGRSVNASSLSFTVDVADGADYLLVVVQIASTCTDGSVAAVSTVAQGSTALAQLASHVGTPCNGSVTRQEHWGLVAPPLGMQTLAVNLSANAATVQVGAMTFTGVNQAAPVRRTAEADGSGTASNVGITSEPGELIVNTVGTGSQIIAPGTDQMVRFLHNVSTNYTADNLAASTEPASAATTTMTWTLANDEWQTISTALQ